MSKRRWVTLVLVALLLLSAAVAAASTQRFQAPAIPEGADDPGLSVIDGAALEETEVPDPGALKGEALEAAIEAERRFVEENSVERLVRAAESGAKIDASERFSDVAQVFGAGVMLIDFRSQTLEDGQALQEATYFDEDVVYRVLWQEVDPTWPLELIDKTDIVEIWDDGTEAIIKDHRPLYLQLLFLRDDQLGWVMIEGVDAAGRRSPVAATVADIRSRAQAVAELLIDGS